MIRTTSIAQTYNGVTGDHFGDGSYFGFVNWTNAVLSSYYSNGAGVPWPSGSLCEDYPAWTTTPQQECYGGPPAGAGANDITVNYTDLDNENVAIDENPVSPFAVRRRSNRR